MGDVLHDIQKRSEVIFAWIGTIHTVVDSDKSDTFFGEHDFRVKADFQIVTPKPRHILYADNIDFSCLNCGNQRLKSGAVEVNTTITIVREMADILKSL